MPAGIVPDRVLAQVSVVLVRPRCAAPGPGTTGTIGRGRRCVSRAGWRSVRGNVRCVPGGVSATIEGGGVLCRMVG